MISGSVVRHHSNIRGLTPWGIAYIPKKQVYKQTGAATQLLEIALTTRGSVLHPNRAFQVPYNSKPKNQDVEYVYDISPIHPFKGCPIGPWGLGPCHFQVFPLMSQALSNRIYVAGLDGKVSASDLRTYFGKWGEMTDVC